MALVWFNGQVMDESETRITVRDTGLLHAAGVFTTMRSYGGKVFNLDRHLARLRDSCEALFIPLQFSDQVLKDAATQLLRQSDLTEARLRLTVTRGQSQQDPLHGTHLHPTCFMSCAELDAYPAEYYRTGLTVMVLDEQKLNAFDIQAGHKTLNYFSRLAALREATRRQAGEALWFNTQNYLQSGSISNVFLVEQGRLVTPPTNQELRDKALASRLPFARSAVLPGTTRATVVELAERLGLPLELAAIDISRLLNADELFLTNSIMGLMPVRRIERHVLPGDGPGPVTAKLSEMYAERVKG